MAGLGLPKTGRIGFEIFDKTNFGITDFAEHVNYRRAVEGELERSVMALAAVQQARVHVSLPKDSVFTDSREAAKASVLVGLRPGARLSPQNVAAIINLVSSAVEGLEAGIRFGGGHERQSAEPPPPRRAARRSADQRGSARISAGHRTRSGGQNQQHARSAARPRQVSNRRIGRSRHDQRRTERRDLRSHQIRDGHLAKNRGHQRVPRAPPRRQRRPELPPICRTAEPRIRRPAASTPASARRASPINPAASPSTSTCRRAPSSDCRSRCWSIKARAGKARASRCIAW